MSKESDTQSADERFRPGVAVVGGLRVTNDGWREGSLSSRHSTARLSTVKTSADICYVLWKKHWQSQRETSGRMLTNKRRTRRMDFLVPSIEEIVIFVITFRELNL